MTSLGRSISTRVPQRQEKGEPSTKASPSSQWPGPSSVTTFIRVLKLLNLDKLDDWPGLTEAIFSGRVSNQSFQQRVKGTEWALYRLFEIWSRKETQDKLKPFFPPLAPLQSKNLRAALFRALSDLKKDGHLGKEIVLRKTMLDECKGEKFEEVLGSLAMLVLRKVMKSKHLQGDHIVRVALTDPRHLSTADQELLLPLILAEHSVLNRNAQQSKEIRLQYDHEVEKIHDVRAQLVSANEQLEVQKGTLVGMSESEKQEAEEITAEFESAWQGDDGWLTEILHSGSGQGSLGDDLRGVIGSGDSISQSRSPKLLTELEERVTLHQNRLRTWQSFQRSLDKKTDTTKITTTKVQKPTSGNLMFTKHQALNIDSIRTLSSHDPEEEGSLSGYTEYQELSDSLAREMADINANKRKGNRQHSPDKVRRDSLPRSGNVRDIDPMAVEPASEPMVSLPSDAVTSFPQEKRPGMTPIKEDVRDIDSMTDEEGMSPVLSTYSSAVRSFPREERPDMTPTKEDVHEVPSKSSKQQTFDDDLPKDHENNEANTESNNQQSQGMTNSPNSTSDVPSSPNQRFSKLTLTSSSPNPPPSSTTQVTLPSPISLPISSSPPKPPPHLLSDLPITFSSPNSHPSSSATPTPSSSMDPPSKPPTTRLPIEDLISRTRQSMSLLPNPPSATSNALIGTTTCSSTSTSTTQNPKRRPSHIRHRSSTARTPTMTYPVNPFDAPSLPKPQSTTIEESSIPSSSSSSSPPKRPSHIRHRSSTAQRTPKMVYPVNPFDTPSLPFRHSPTRDSFEDTPSSPPKSSSPSKQLMSPQMQEEYDMIFKPRPKIGMGGMRSPDRVATFPWGDEDGEDDGKGEGGGMGEGGESWI